MGSIFTTCRQAVKDAAEPVPPFNAPHIVNQVVLGDYNWAAGSDFFGNIITTGPWLFIKPTKGEADGVKFNGMFEFNADMVYGFEDNMAYDWTAIDDIIAALVEAWVSYSKFVKGGVLGPFKLTWKEPEVKHNPMADGTSGFIARTVFTFTIPFVADQGAS